MQNMFPLNQQENEESGDWTEKFIQAIQPKAAIWDCSLPEYADRHYVNSLWEKVYETMVPTWKNMSQHEQLIKGKELQNRWKNLRTCFRRELAKQRCGISGPGAFKRRKYIYFDQLLFLKGTVGKAVGTKKQSPANTPQQDRSESEDDMSFVDLPASTSNNVRPVASPSFTQESLQPLKRKKSSKIQSFSNVASNYDESVLNTLREKRDEEIDEDKTFLLSLVPMLRRLNETQKIDAKIEFLSTLKSFFQHEQESKKQLSQPHPQDSAVSQHTINDQQNEIVETKYEPASPSYL